MRRDRAAHVARVLFVALLLAWVVAPLFLG